MAAQRIAPLSPTAGNEVIGLHLFEFTEGGLREDAIELLTFEIEPEKPSEIGYFFLRRVEQALVHDEMDSCVVAML